MRVYLSRAIGPTERDYGDGFVVALPPQAQDRETEPCATCGRPHDVLYTVKRRATAWGHWPVVRLAGASHVIDASLPHAVRELPRDAVRVPADTAAALWHDSSGSHTFGGPDVGAMLRANVAMANREVAR